MFIRLHLWLALSVLTLLIAPHAAAQDAAIGNRAYADAFTVLSRLDARNGAPRPHSSAITVDGYLAVVYAEESDNPQGGIALFDLSDPTQPRKVGGTEENTGLLAEQHAIGWHRDGDKLYAAMLAVGGIEIWDWSDVHKPTQISRLELPGVHLGYALGAWWLFWQAPYIYVSGTSNGLFIVDAADPQRPQLVTRDDGPNPLPVSQTGGFRIGPVFAVGNLLVVSANDGSGYATLDISDPRNPALIAAVRDEAPPSYSSMVNGNAIYAAGTDNHLHIFDIRDPAAIEHVGAADMDGRGGYLTLQDGFAHVGASEHYVKVDVRDPHNPQVVGTASSGLANRDEDFAVVHGNLVTIGDDHGNGTTIIAHDTAPDTTGPSVTMVSPADGALEQARSSRVGLTFSDQIDLRSVNAETLIVRKVGGAQVTGRISGQTGIVNFWPDAPLDAETAYEVILPAGGVRDVVGNPLAQEFRATFSTGLFLDAPVRCTIEQHDFALVDRPADFRVRVDSDVGRTEQIWRFGDGRDVTIPLGVDTVRTTYSAPGHYTMRVVAGNDQFRTACATQVTAIHPVVPGHPTSSSTIIFDADRARVWNVNPDNDTVTITSGVDHTKLAEQPVGDNPRTLAQAPDGTVWVVNQDDASISILAPEDGRPVATLPLPPASQPYGIVFTPDRRHAFVTLQATGVVLRLDPTSRAVTGQVDVGPTPRGLAASHVENRVFVARYISPDDGGIITELDPDTLEIVRVHTLAMDPGPDTEASGRGLPNGLGAPVVTPDGRRLWIPSKKDNIQRGQQRDGQTLTFESTVRPIVSQVDLVENRELLPARIDFNDREGPVAVLFSPFGDYAFVLMQGSNAVEVVDVFSGEVVTAIEDVGAAPAGMALTDSSTLFVHGWLSRTVRHRRGRDDPLRRRPATATLLATVGVVGHEMVPEDVLRGKQIFYFAGDKRMSRDGYIACASCHLDGAQDGRVWDRTAEGEGLRNTIDLRTPQASSMELQLR
ncbi:MAG: Ig-like domain-containing protein [Caldilineaceae bacterium]